MSERELFLKWWNDNNLPYENDDKDKKLAWEAWQASANRDGYKLVPKSFIADIHDMALDGKYLRETDQSQEKFTEIHELCKEAMIEAVE